MEIQFPQTVNPESVSFREVSIRALLNSEEMCKYIRSNNEKVLEINWFIDRGAEEYLAFIAYEYFDGYEMTEDVIRLVTPMML